MEHGNLTPDEMRLIKDTYRTLDLKNLNREYAYTEEELNYYLKSRLINRMMVRKEHQACFAEEGMHSKPDGFPLLEFA